MSNLILINIKGIAGMGDVMSRYAAVKLGYPPSGRPKSGSPYQTVNKGPALLLVKLRAP